MDGSQWEVSPWNVSTGELPTRDTTHLGTMRIKAKHLLPRSSLPRNSPHLQTTPFGAIEAIEAIEAKNLFPRKSLPRNSHRGHHEHHSATSSVFQKQPHKSLQKKKSKKEKIMRYELNRPIVVIYDQDSTQKQRGTVRNILKCRSSNHLHLGPKGSSILRSFKSQQELALLKYTRNHFHHARRKANIAQCYTIARQCFNLHRN